VRSALRGGGGGGGMSAAIRWFMHLSVLLPLIDRVARSIAQYGPLLWSIFPNKLSLSQDEEGLFTTIDEDT
jgi:hypothetical protein